MRALLLSLALGHLLALSSHAQQQQQQQQAPLLPASLLALRSGTPVRPSAQACSGRRVWVQDLGAQFHRDLLYGDGEQDSRAFGRGTGVNGGFGPEKRGRARARDPKALLAGVSAASEEHYHEQYHDYSEGTSNTPAGAGAAADGAGAGAGRNGSSSSRGAVLRRRAAAVAAASASAAGEGEGQWPALKKTWFDTWANALDVIFHSRMEHYACRVASPEEADLVYVPYYGSLDISRHLGKKSLQRGRLGRELATRLAQHPRFQRRGGKDYFVVIGRPYWDFVSNISNPSNPWGTDMLNVPAMKAVKVVTVEGSVWNPSTVGGPYATSFHPPTRSVLATWRKFVTGHARSNLFAFGGAVRRGAKQASIARAGVIRERILWQCSQSSRCRLLDCENPPRACERDWRIFTQLYLSSTFCIHPPGDSCTRRAVLDSMLAGCIPVLLEQCTVEHQYQWLLGSAGNFSMFVDGATLKSSPEADSLAQVGSGLIGNGDVMLEEVLGAIPEAQVRKMQRLVMKFIPLITFGGRSQRDGTILPPDYADAFDYLVLHLSKMVKESAPN